MKTSKKKDDDTRISNDAFDRVAKAFVREREVSRGARKGFGSGALTVNGKIFSMITSKGEFVVKLPKARVDELVASGAAEVFEPRPGRAMKEWAVVRAPAAKWVAIAKEARTFVKRGSGG
jgi:hypothetical protein